VILILRILLVHSLTSFQHERSTSARQPGERIRKNWCPLLKSHFPQVLLLVQLRASESLLLGVTRLLFFGVTRLFPLTLRIFPRLFATIFLPRAVGNFRSLRISNEGKKTVQLFFRA
jgi:hypothetical protein